MGMRPLSKPLSVSRVPSPCGVGASSGRAVRARRQPPAPGCETQAAGSPETRGRVFAQGKRYSRLMETSQKPQFDSIGCYY